MEHSLGSSSIETRCALSGNYSTDNIIKLGFIIVGRKGSRVQFNVQPDKRLTSCNKR